jgi:hypothetical protein
MARTKKTDTDSKTTVDKTEVNRITKKNLNNLTPDELTTLIRACETDDSGEIEIQIAFSLANEPPEGTAEANIPAWQAAHPSVVTPEHLELCVQKIKSPLLAIFLLVYHDLRVEQLHRLDDRMKDPIVSKTVQKALTAKFTNLKIEELKPLQTTPANEAEAS